MKIHVMTLFPEMINAGVNTSILKKAIENGYLDVDAVNIRDYSLDKHKKVDDYPYGGGAGMLMQAQPIYDAYRAVVGTNKKKIRTIYVTPQGSTFNQKMAEEFAKEEELVFLCGHYEGIDERVLEEVVTDYISIGDYVLTGGELPAMVMIDAIARLIPGVLHNDISAETESFHRDLLEYPQYSRPEVWMGKEVPKVLLSGDHKKITKWRKEAAEIRTRERRPDLYAKYLEVEEFIAGLKKKKRKFIHVSESLSTGRGSLLYKGKDSFAVFEKVSGELYLEGNVPEEIINQLKGIKSVVTCHEAIADLYNGQKKVFWQALYTKKETLPVKYKDIRRISAAEIQDFSLQEDYPYLLGCYIQEELKGILGGRYPGRMDELQVSDGAEKTEIEASLEAFMINEALSLDLTPYVRIEKENNRLKALQEDLGLYLYEEQVFHVFW